MPTEERYVRLSAPFRDGLNFGFGLAVAFLLLPALMWVGLLMLGIGVGLGG